MGTENKSILVRATATGLYGTLREIGEEFEITDQKDFSKRWMAKVAVKDRAEKESGDK